MKKHSISLFLWVTIGSIGLGGSVKKAYELAEKRNMPNGAPQYSDVLMRSLHIRPANDKDPLLKELHITPSGKQDPHNTLHAIRDFHVNYLVWSYIRDRDFINTLREMGCRFGNAINSTDVGNEKIGNTIKDLDGNPVTPPWMRVWDPKPTGTCVNHPKTVNALVERFSTLIEIGMDSLQVDDYQMNVASRFWGGCYCPYCTDGFQKYMKDRQLSKEQYADLGIEKIDDFDITVHLEKLGIEAGDHTFSSPNWNLKLREHYVQFQMQSVQHTMETVKAKLEEKFGKELVLSCNNGSGNWPSYAKPVYDFGMGEYNIRDVDPQTIYDRFVEIEQLGKGQVFTMPKGHALVLSEHEPVISRFIAMVYACGGQMLMPWDIYLKSRPGGSVRYFGRPDQYADLSGFIRGAAEYLDGYERVSAAGFGIQKTLGDHPPVIVEADSSMTAVVRAKPGFQDAPVAVHLINWSDDQKPVEIMLNPYRFFGDKPMKLWLWTPTEYNSAEHQKAEQTKDYSTLVNKRLLAEGKINHIEIPPIKTWGMLVVEQSGNKHKDQIWTPIIEPFGGQFIKSQKIEIRNVSPNQKIHYTLDGTLPDQNSPIYSQPVEIQDSCLFKAAAFEGPNQSEVVDTVFIKSDYANAITIENPKEGLNIKAKAGDFDHLVDFSNVRPDKTEVVRHITQITQLLKSPQQALHAEGFIKIPEDGFYNLSIFSNNRTMETKIYIDGELVSHSKNNYPLIKKRMPLEKGFHTLRIDHYQNDEKDNYLAVYLQGTGLRYGILSNHMLFHKPVNEQ